MKRANIVSPLLFSLAVFTGAGAKTVLVFPVSGEAVEAQDLASVTRLFRDAIEARSPGDSVSVSPTACRDRDCALATARTGSVDPASEVVYSSFYKLGTKWIFSATIVNADGSNSFSQRLTATSIEDMEAVTLRMADAVMTRKTLEQVASIDNITEREEDSDPSRRRSLYKGGLAVGYIFPAGRSFQYKDVASAGAINRSPEYSQLIRLTWLNTWEFRNDLSLGTDIVWNIPNSIGADANLKYIFGRGDISPFVGGGLGLHYVHDDHWEDSEDDPHKRNSGPAVNAQAGLMLFRTYDVNVMVRGQYQVIFNSDMDQGVAADVGVTFGNRGGHSNGSGSSEGFGPWDFVGLGSLVLFVLVLAVQ